MTDTARRILLAILLLGVAGIIAELLLLGHDEDFYQWIPIALAIATMRSRGGAWNGRPSTRL